MNRLVVEYQGQRVGVLAEARGGIFFEYDRAFIETGHELSPLMLPLGSGVRSRDASPTLRLHGLFEDSLPDQWGRRLMTEGFRQRGVAPSAITPLMMLAYVGSRGMGALIYRPELDVSDAPGNTTLAQLHDAAEAAEADGPVDLALLAEVGSSAGGARPKALVGVKQGGPEVVVSTHGLPSGFEPWLVKFDTSDKGGAGNLEQAYALLARAAGIEMPESRTLTTRHGKRIRHHFAIKRFDRVGDLRIHHHTLASMSHLMGGDLDYSTFLRVTRRITRDEREVWKAYRRAAFNVLASNRDDHGKNHGFLYRNGDWKLGPAYDLTYTSLQQLPERGMSVIGERRRAGPPELLKLADVEALERKQALTTIDEVKSALNRWAEFAEEAGVPRAQAREATAQFQMS